MTEIHRPTLKDFKYDLPNPDAQWGPEYFEKVYGAFQNLRGLDIQQKEGLEGFLDILDFSEAKSWDSETLSSAHKGFSREVNGRLSQFSVKNARGLAGVLEAPLARSFAENSPTFVYDGVDDDYKIVAQAIEGFQGIREALQDEGKRGAYFEEMLSTVGDKTHQVVWQSMAQEVLQGRMLVRERQAGHALNVYGGAQRFIGENVQYAVEAQKSWNALLKEVREARVKKEEEVGGPLSATEEREFMEKYKDRMESKRAGVVAQQTLPQYVGRLQELAYKAIQKKKEEEENAKKPKE